MSYTDFSDKSVGFQFHKGAIRTNVYAQAFASTAKFQFHKGAIRTYFEFNL